MTTLEKATRFMGILSVVLGLTLFIFAEVIPDSLKIVLFATTLVSIALFWALGIILQSIK